MDEETGARRLRRHRLWRSRLLVATILLTCYALAIACDGETEAEDTPTNAAATLTLTPSVTLTPEPDPAAAPGSLIEPPDGSFERVVVTAIVDGDTVVLEDGRRLRYIGIDTPETVEPGAPVQCFGPEASERNQALVLGKTVLLESDVNDLDRFGRLLRYVFLEDGTMVNRVLVEEGYAISKAYPPDTRHQDSLDAAQEAAKAAGRGIWASCALTPSPTATAAVTPTPPGLPQGACPEGCEVPPVGCLIKGNISSEHIYHIPGQQHYEDTVITPSRGERWFCTEDEAIANGWRKAQR